MEITAALVKELRERSQFVLCGVDINVLKFQGNQAFLSVPRTR